MNRTLSPLPGAPNAVAPAALMVSDVPLILDPDRLLRRRELAAALRAKGFPSTPGTLATLVTRGGGPPFRKFGAIVLYRWSDALQWANAKLTAPRTSSSEVVLAAAKDAPKGE